MSLNESELRELIEHLQLQWVDSSRLRTLHQPAARRGQQVRGSDVSRMMSVYGLTRHVHETARAIVVRIEAGHSNAAVPFVRVAYESALTAAWLVQSKGEHGIKALLHEHARIRLALRKESLKALSESFRTGADEIADADPAPNDTLLFFTAASTVWAGRAYSYLTHDK